MNEHLGIYLNDHLAGSVLAIELLEHLEKAHAGKELEKFIARLRADILADQQVLEGLMRHLEITTSRPRKAMAWLTEKFTELKLRFDDTVDGSLRLLESLEVIAIGIDGKTALWRSLAGAAEINPWLRNMDYTILEQRAKEQRLRIEVERLNAAKLALKA
jgi:hypothetical protein